MVGVGLVAQNIHVRYSLPSLVLTLQLPNLQLCSHLFRVAALVDVSPMALEHASAKFHIPRTYTDVGAMLADADDIDVVMIMSAE